MKTGTISLDEIEIEDTSPGFDGLDELAASLGVRASNGPGRSVLLEGKSGRHYDFVELLQAHVDLMKVQS